jgi:hypothetical protein
MAADLLTAANGSGTPPIVLAEGPRRYNAIEVATTLAALLGQAVVARQLSRSEGLAALVRGGVSVTYAELVAAMYDAHNLGRIDAEDDAGEIRRGPTELRDVFVSLLRHPGLTVDPADRKGSHAGR